MIFSGGGTQGKNKKILLLAAGIILKYGYTNVSYLHPNK